MLRQLRQKLVNWLLKDAHIERLEVGENTVSIDSNNIALPGTVDGVDVSAHAANADAHHARSHDHSNALDGSPIAVAGVPSLDAAKITTGRFGVARMPDGTLGQVLTAQGAGVDPAYAAAPGGGLAVFGDGSDGDVTIAADAPLSRDMFYNNLTVNAGITLSTGGYRIFVKGTLTNNGTISRNGNNGGNGANGAAGGAAGGAQAPGLSAGSLGASALGNGGGSGSETGDGGAGNTGGSITVSLGKVGGSGGAGGAGTGPSNGGAGGAAGTVTEPTTKDGQYSSPFIVMLKEVETTVNKINGGSGAGGGGGGGKGSGGYCGGGGGGGGSGAGILVLAAKAITNSGTISTKGGTGGNGGNGASSGAGRGGGGGGGGGGLLVIIYSSATWGTEIADGGAGGLAGSGTGQGGANGNAGTNGKVIKLQC